MARKQTHEPLPGRRITEPGGPGGSPMVFLVIAVVFLVAVVMVRAAIF